MSETQKQLYRRTVLIDLMKGRGMPAQDHPHLHKPDLSANEWSGSKDEIKALEPLVKKLLEHLAAHP